MFSYPSMIGSLLIYFHQGKLFLKPFVFCHLLVELKSCCAGCGCTASELQEPFHHFTLCPAAQLLEAGCELCPCFSWSLAAAQHTDRGLLHN